MGVLHYARNAKEIHDAVCAHRSVLKIVLKVKNDPIFLEEWIEHHSRIAGIENLIIADNMSDDPQMFEVYEKYAGRLFVFQFTGFYDRIHKQGNFPAFYDALYESAEFFQILDADERMVLLTETNVISDERILGALTQNAGEDFLLGTWFFNKQNQRDIFNVYTSSLPKILMGGKSLFSSRFRSQLPSDTAINHNHGIPDPEVNFASVARTQIGILHYTRLDLEQRMRSNREKLVAQKLVEPGTPFEAIAEMEFGRPYADTMAREIKSALEDAGREDGGEESALCTSSFRIEADGSLAFGSEEARDNYMHILNSPRELIFAGRA